MRRCSAHGGFAFLDVDERVDVVEATFAYFTIDGVDYARPEWMVGGSPDVDAAKVQGTWHFVFRNAWGDCPAGCIYSELSFFIIANGEVHADRASAEARSNGLLRDASRGQGLALIGMEAGLRPFKRLAGRSCRSGRSC